MVTIKNEELYFSFRKMELSDVEFVGEVRRSAAEFLHDSTKYSNEQVRKWLQTGPETTFWLVRFHQDDIGYFRVKPLSDSSALVGADFHQDFRGKGLAKPAYREFVATVLIPIGFKNLYLKVLMANERAIALYRGLGFTEMASGPNGIEMFASAEEILNGRRAHGNEP